MIFRMRRNIILSTPLARSSGFTLIEVVVLTSLIGIVAAFAVPRYTRLANTVRASEVTALGAKLRQAALTAHAQVLVPGPLLSAITMGGKTVILRNGYPDATANGIRKAVFDSEGFTVDEGVNFVTFIRADAPSGQQCSVTYQAASEDSRAATITAPEISGC